jgi:hypothetical protein
VELDESVSDPSGWAIEPVRHPLSRVLTAEPEEVLRKARVSRYFRAKLTDGARAGVTVSGRDDPLIAEKSIGRGKVVVLACPADPKWTNVVVEPGFYPLLIHEALTWLGRQEHERPFDVATVTRNGLTWAELSSVERPGFYEVRSEKTSPLYVAVNVDPAESSVRPLNVSELTEAFRGLPVLLVPDNERVEVAVRRSRVGRELWKRLIVAALLTFLAEGLLALWFTRRASRITGRETQ